LYGPGAILLGAAALSAAGMLPWVPLYSAPPTGNRRPPFSLPWRIVGWAAGIALILVTIAATASVF
jgi:hypothetical protein